MRYRRSRVEILSTFGICDFSFLRAVPTPQHLERKSRCVYPDLGFSRSKLQMWCKISGAFYTNSLTVRSKTNKRLKERFLIGRNGTKRANVLSFFRMLAVSCFRFFFNSQLFVVFSSFLPSGWDVLWDGYFLTPFGLRLPPDICELPASL